MINNFYTHALGLLLVMFGAIAWEVYDDRRGDHNKREDVFKRGALVLLASIINTLLNNPYCEDGRRTLTFLLLSLNLSIASFFAIFDYLISYILLKNKTIELPNSSTDTWFSYKRGGGLPFWRKASPKTRLYIRAAYLALSLAAYLIYVL